MTLPLLERARAGDTAFVYTPRRNAVDGLVQIGRTSVLELTPTRALSPGEQYRFHFDMSKCIGCKCCVVACNEQNGNPAGIQWRRVGEIEGGHYPHTKRHYLSMGCNHCLEPSCMTGCPVEAYTKDPVTGIVLHSADTCIGCQYCTWNCSYGVPQYNPERGVVGKCDMCHHRLADGMAPACVSACPEGAIAIEIVDALQWRIDHLTADAPGLPSSQDSLSTTRVTLPAALPPDIGRVDTQQIHLEDAHWQLVLMLVFTQMAVGAFGCLWLLQLAGSSDGLMKAALVSLLIAALSLGASTFHLGRPIHAWRALKGWRHSWLSREVIGLSAFAGTASFYAGLLVLDELTHAVPASVQLATGLVTLLCGVAGVGCSARLYAVKARPAWNSPVTPLEFFSTALLLGPLFVRTMGFSHAEWLPTVAFAAAGMQLGTQVVKLFWLMRSDSFELRASAMLISARLDRILLARFAGLIVAGMFLPLQFSSVLACGTTLLLAIGTELLGRWIFFVSVVPKSIASSFAATRSKAA